MTCLVCGRAALVSKLSTQDGELVACENDCARRIRMMELCETRDQKEFELWLWRKRRAMVYSMPFNDEPPVDSMDRDNAELNARFSR